MARKVNTQRLSIWATNSLYQMLSFRPRKLTISRFLIWAGAVLIVLDVIVNLYYGFALVFRVGPSHVVGFNFGTEITILVNSVFDGGVLIGLGKIIEVLQKRGVASEKGVDAENEVVYEKRNNRVE